MTRYDDNGFPVKSFSMNRKTKMIILGMVASLLLIGSVAAYVSISGSSTGNVTATPADLQLTGTVTSSAGATCTITAGSSFSCTGFSVGEGGVETEVFQIQNTGQSDASVTPTTSSITPTGATCTVAGPANIPGGSTQTYTLTYTGGSTPGTASCDTTV